MSQKVITRCEEETIQCAKDFSSLLKPGMVLALKGDLGSGKTTFIKGIALGLGLKNSDEVTSPTFALMNVYETKIPLYHFDLYRLEKASEVVDIGFEEFVNNPNSVSCVEWPEKAGGFMPLDAKEVRLATVSETERKIELPTLNGG